MSVKSKEAFQGTSAGAKQMDLVRASANLIEIKNNQVPPNTEEKEPTDGIKS